MSRALVVTRPIAFPADEPAPSLRGNVIAGTLAIAIGFGGFLLWGYTAELDSAAVGSGSVVVNTKLKTVTHLEGGILQALLVNEGDKVRAGQPLVRLENTRAKADLGQMDARRVGYLAKLARLSAEQDGATSISFPPELLASSNPFFLEILRNERLLFQRRQETFQRTLESQRKQIDVFSAEADASAAQLAANTRQQELIQTQIDAIQTLADKGFATRAQLVDLEGKLSMLAGNGGEYAANKARSEMSMAGAHLEISKTQTSWQSDIADAMQQTRIELNSLLDNMAAAADVLKRVELTSPEDGIVTNIQLRTPGGVVAAGQPIMEIVPEHDARIVEARIDPRDIDSVHVGAKVQVKLSAYGIRQTPALDGVLTYIAADQSVDEHTNAAYYIVRAEVTEEALAKAPEVELYPGMPADLLVLNRPRLAIDYILSPLTDSLRRAFREE